MGRGSPRAAAALARELVALKVDVIVTLGTVPISAAKDATRTGLTLLVLLARVESSRDFVGRAESAARGLGLTVRSLRVAAVDEYEHAFKTAQRERAGAVQVLPSPIFGRQRRTLIDLAAKYRLPAIYEYRDYVDDGGPMSYGPSVIAMFRGAAGYVDRILKGARPEDLPIACPTTFELVINLRTAQALGLTISPEVRGRADELIR